MTNLWTNKTVAFNPLFINDNFLGFAIVSDTDKVFYSKDVDYRVLLSDVKSVIVFDGFAISKKLENFPYLKYNLRTLYFQYKSNVRFQTISDIVKQELFTEKTNDYVFMSNTDRIDGAKQCITEASFIRKFYLAKHKLVNKEILKIDNTLLKELSLKDNIVKIDQLSIRTDISTYQLKQWEIERKIFYAVGYPVAVFSQVPYNKQNSDMQKMFIYKNKYKAKYDSLINYLGLEEINLVFDVTGSSTGRIFCKVENKGLFSPDNSYKKNFCSLEGQTLISADYSKQEASIIACISKDEKLQKDLLNKNYYAKLAKLLIGVEDKQTGKDLFYSLIYGISIKVLANKLNISEKKAEKVKKKLQERYPVLIKWLNSICTSKENYFGRKLYESTANAYIQSTAADIIRIKLIQTIKYNPICVFSDNIIYSVPTNIVNECKQEIQKILEDQHPFKLSVQIAQSDNFNF